MVINKTYDLEAKLTKDVQKFLVTQPDLYHFKASERFIKGVSDILCCCGGVFIAIELKAEYNTATPQQLNFIRKIVLAGGIGGVCKSVQDVQALLTKARERKK